MLTINQKRNLQGWALFAPAAFLLIAFTHYPTVATFFKSLFSNNSIIRPSRFTGFESYQNLLNDPIFWKVFTNNMWLALGTIPTSIGLAIVMALIVNKAIPESALLLLLEIMILQQRMPISRCYDGVFCRVGSAVIVPA